MHSNKESRTSVRQHTMLTSLSAVGVGLHSGIPVTLTLRPAEPDTGIVFVRTDLPGEPARIPALYDSVVDTQMCTKIANEDGVSVGTIEHLMAALNAMEIDNLEIELDGPEVPIMDGSSAPFIFLIESVGTVAQNASRKYIRIKRDIDIEIDGKTARFTPSDSFSVNFRIAFDTTAIGEQEIEHSVSRDSFKSELSRARTFGFLQEVEYLRSIGLAKGGSLDNAIVIDDGKVLNESGLRYDDEFVRHKALDAVGDLYLAGARILGAFSGFKAGHQVNNELLHALFKQQDAWEWTELPSADVIEVPTSSEVTVPGNVISFPMEKSRAA